MGDASCGTRPRQTALAVAVAAVLVVSMAAPLAGAAAAPERAADSAGPDATAPTVQDAEIGSSETGAVDSTAGSVAGADGSTANAGDASDAADARGDGVVASALDDANGSVTIVARLDAVRTADTTSPASATQSLRTKARAAQEPVTSWAAETDGATVLEQFWLANAVLLEVDTERTPLESVAGIDGVRRVHSNFEVSIPEPDRGLAAANASDYDVTYGLDQIDAPEVWDAYDTMGEGARVAVLDTGVHAAHPDIEISEAHWAEFDGNGDQVDSEPHATTYHGTHVSGTVVGENNSGQYVGVAPEATLLHGLVLPNGSGSFAQVVAGMEWAVDEDADVVSMSLGASGFNAEYIEPVRNAQDAGTLVVASSGNDGEGTSGSPGNVYDSYAVGASDENRSIADFSSGEVVNTAAAWGGDAPDDWPAEYVVPDVAAPGVNVLSAVPPGTFPEDPDAVYGIASGTSMAAPHVSGAAALAMSAANGDVSTADVRDALTQSATKPEDVPDEKDPRYGDGIVDAKVATDLVAAEQGVEGTVTTPDGGQVGDIAVSLNDTYEATTASDGSYQIRAPAGTYEVTAAADALGYAFEPQTVTVTDGNFTELNITLEETLGVELADGQPVRAESGSDVAASFDAANVDSVTVTASGDYDASEAALYVNGEQAAFGSPVSFDDYSGTVDVTVETAAGTSGNLSLTHAFEGAGESTEVETGPTVVVEDYVEVAVVDAPGGEHGDDLVPVLEAPGGRLPLEYNLSVVRTTELRDRLGDHEVYVVQSFGQYDQNAGLVQDFVNATDGPDTGVVYLDQYALSSEGIPALSAVTGDPAETFEGDYIYFEDDRPVTYEVQADHPLVAGVAGEGDSVVVHDEFRHDHTWFEGFSGTTVAAVGNGSETFGPALAADGLSRTVLASSLGRSTRIRNFDYTTDADRILANAVEYASVAPPVVRTAAAPTRVDTGDPVTQTFDVTELDEVRVSVADSSTLAADDLTLYLDGKVNAFDEWRAYDPAKNGDLNVTVVPDEDAVGELSLELAFVGGGADETVQTGSGPTAIYDPPLVVGDDVDTIAAGVDLAPFGENVTVFLENGTYEEAVTLNKGGVTIRPVEGANATIAPGPDDVPAVLVNDTTDATVSGVGVDAAGGVGVRVWGAQDVDVTDVAVANATRGFYVSDAPTRRASTSTDDVLLSRVAVTGADEGVFFQDNTFTPVGEYTLRNATVDADDIGVHARSTAGAVEDTTIENASTGVQAVFGDDISVHDTDVVDTDTAVSAPAFAAGLSVRGVTVENATTGFSSLGFGVSGTLADNEFHGDTGLSLGGAALTVRGNDLANTSTAVANAGSTDVTLNYFGERGPANTTVQGGTAYDPYLTRDPATFSWTLGNISETTYVGTDADVPEGDPVALGVPGPGVGTLADVFGTDFDGAVYAYDGEHNDWTLVDGDYEPSPLEALLVVPSEDGRAAFEFRVDGPGKPTQRTVREGWNFVAPPESAPVEAAVRHSTAEFTAALGLHGEPTNAIAPPGGLDGWHEFAGDGDGPLVNPFAGYFLFAESSGLTPGLLAANPDAERLRSSLGVGESSGDAVAPTQAVADAAVAAADAVKASGDESQVRAAAEQAARAAADEHSVSLSGFEVDLVVEYAVRQASGDDEPSTRSALSGPAAGLPGDVRVHS